MPSITMYSIKNVVVSVYMVFGVWCLVFGVVQACLCFAELFDTRTPRVAQFGPVAGGTLEKIAEHGPGWLASTLYLVHPYLL